MTFWVSWHQKGKIILGFNEAINDGWQWHHLDHMQFICTLLQQITMPVPHHSIFTDRMPFLRPTNSIKAVNNYKKTIKLVQILRLWRRLKQQQQTTATVIKDDSVMTNSNDTMLKAKMTWTHLATRVKTYYVDWKKSTLDTYWKV